MVEQIGRAIDRIIGIFSPSAESKRVLHRNAAKILRERQQYAAAKTSRLTGDWFPISGNVNSVIGASNPQVKARIRQLVRDFPYFARAVNVLVDFTVNEGLQFQSRIKSKDGKLDKVLCQRTEDAMAFWMDEADISGKMHFYELMRLAKRQDVESGEFLIAKVINKNPNRYSPFALQIYEADWLSNYDDNYPSRGPSEIYQGIEYDRVTGRIIAYHFVDPDSYSSKPIIIAAENVVHGFDIYRPGQLRGVSPFAPAVLVAHDLGDYMDATMDVAKLAAKWLAFVKSPDPTGYQAMRVDSQSGIAGKQIETLENAVIEYLRPGEDISFSSPNSPGDTFDPFTRFILRMVAITVNISYELLTGDYQGLNYSVLRGVRNDLVQQFKPMIRRHVRQFCTPIFKPALDMIVMSGKLNLPGYFANPGLYQRCQWIPSGMPPIDPLKEGRADADGVSACLRSPQEVAAARGRDIEEVYDELAEAQRMREERGIIVKSVSNSLSGNPASLEGEQNEDQTITNTKSIRGTALSLIRS